MLKHTLHCFCAASVAEELGLSMDAIEVVHGDTDQVARGVGTYGSRSLQAGGTAVAGATTDVIEQARKLTAAKPPAAEPAEPTPRPVEPQR